MFEIAAGTALAAAVVLAAMALALMRVAGHKSQTFQAFAHLFVGGMIAWAIVGWVAFPAIVAGVLSAVELFAFIVNKRRA